MSPQRRACTALGPHLRDNRNMSKKSAPPVTPESRITDVDVSTEMKGSFLEYAYSVIYTRALPDARDGLKPVQRRILFQMDQLGLRPDRGHVKSSRVVGEVMGKLHPHGDAAIYDALVRLAQPFNQRVPLVDGHGNFGSLDDGPAAPRYTEVRLAPAAELLTAQLDEDTVDFVPNYDNQFLQPEVLPAGFPALLVNGASGIAVGMATTIAPHNPREVLAAAIHLLHHRGADVDALLKYVPGPDFPGGGIIHDVDSVHEAYRTGRGSFKVRGKVSIERITARKMGLIITELPYMVGPERVIERIKDAVNSGKLKGISAVTNLTDRHHGLRLVVDIKSGFNPQAVLASLYKLTPLEEPFSVNAVALVAGQPRLLTLKEMLQVFVDHRLEVTRRRSEYRLNKNLQRLHLVEGLLIAILDIDEVIAIIRAADDARIASERLQLAFDLSAEQAEYILELRLRRLTKLSRLELEGEKGSLEEEIEALEAILSSPERMASEVEKDLLAAAQALDTPRRTTLLTDGGEAEVVPTATGAGEELEIPDEPCLVVLTSRGGLVRVAGDEPLETGSGAPEATWLAAAPTTTRSRVGVVGADGVAHRLDVVALPGLARTPGAISLSAAVPAAELLEGGAAPVGIVPLDGSSLLTLATRRGIVKRVRPEHPESKDTWQVISLEDGDSVVSATVGSDDDDLVFITKAGQLLRTPADKVRPQGPPAGGMAGIRLAAGDEVIFFGSIAPTSAARVATVASTGGTLAGTAYTSIKVTPLLEFPQKGRATQGVRCHRLLRGEDYLGLAWAGPHEPRAESATGNPVKLPEAEGKRDGSGTELKRSFVTLG